MKEYYLNIKELCKKYSGTVPDAIKPLPATASNRHYFRVFSGNQTYIAAHNPDRAENEAFLYVSGKLSDSGVNVPEIFLSDLGNDVYLLEDIGDTCLFDLVGEFRKRESPGYIKWYKKVIDAMPDIQITCAKDFDFSVCYPRSAFDTQSILWDLNYFKYYYLKLMHVPFHEQKLEDDFVKLAAFLSEADSDFFLYRDFQSRNIMIKDEEVFFIDYQGGRRGALQYDLASLLFEAKVGLSISLRQEILDYYLEVFSGYPAFERKNFLKYFPAFSLIRILQAFGAYGYRGYFERKPFFLQSIPPALKNLKWLLQNHPLGVALPHLQATLDKMLDRTIEAFPETDPEKLTLSISSFSYKKGIPEDYSGNGGGFVFDCRSLPNPGRLEEYRDFTGKDRKVADFLGDKNEVEQFIEQVNFLVSASVEEYMHRGFNHLMVSFGCTGGQHRSVYNAEILSRAMKKKYDINVVLNHRELVNKQHDEKYV